MTGAVSGKRLCKEACSARMGASQLWSCLVLRGMEASQLPGAVKGECFESALVVVLSSVFFFGGTGASQLGGGG